MVSTSLIFRHVLTSFIIESNIFLSSDNYGSKGSTVSLNSIPSKKQSKSSTFLTKASSMSNLKKFIKLKRSSSQKMPKKSKSDITIFVPNSSEFIGNEEINNKISVDNIPNSEVGVKVTYEEDTPVIKRGRRLEEKKKRKRKFKKQVSML